MKRTYVARVLVLLLLTVPVHSQQSQVLYTALTVDATAGGVAIPTATLRPNPAGQPQVNGCHFRLETAEVRFRYDGVGPTAAEGTLLLVNDQLEIGFLPDLLAIRFIRTGAVSGTLRIHCWTNR